MEKAKNKFIHTPENWTELETRINQLPDSEKAVAAIYAGMAWNLACDVADGEFSRATAGRPPMYLNGTAKVIAFAPYKGRLSDEYAILAYWKDNSPAHPYVVAHWSPVSGKSWNWGDYCESYQEALNAFYFKAGINTAVETG